MTPPPLTVEEQLRVVCDAWINADDRNRCVWEQEDAAVELFFGYLASGGGSWPRLLLDLRLIEQPQLNVVRVVAWTWSGCSIPLEVQTVADLAEHLELEIDWKDFEPF